MNDGVISENLIRIGLLLIGSLIVLYLIRRFFLFALKRSRLYELNDPYLHFAILFIKKFFWPIYVLASFYLGVNFFVEVASLKLVLMKAFLFLITFVGIFMAQSLVAFTLDTIIENQKRDNPTAVNTLQFSKILANILVWILGVLLVLGNLGYNVNSLITGLGIGGIAIALAVQTILGDMINSVSIIFDKPFKLGDSISIGTDSGTVEHIGIKTTRIRSVHGELLVIPNTDLVKSRIQNFQEMSRRRVVLTLGLAYSSTSKQLLLAKDLIKKTLEATPDITLDRVHIDRFTDYSIILETVYFVETPDYNLFMDRKEHILLALKDAFAANQITLALPTQAIISR